MSPNEWQNPPMDPYHLFIKNHLRDMVTKKKLTSPLICFCFCFFQKKNNKDAIWLGVLTRGLWMIHQLCDPQREIREMVTINFYAGGEGRGKGRKGRGWKSKHGYEFYAWPTLAVERMSSGNAAAIQPYYVRPFMGTIQCTYDLNMSTAVFHSYFAQFFNLLIWRWISNAHISTRVNVVAIYYNGSNNSRKTFRYIQALIL